MRVMMVVLLWIAIPAKADDWADYELSIAGGLDVIHTQDTDIPDEYAEIRYRSIIDRDLDKKWIDHWGWSVWGGMYDTVGVGIFGTYGPFMVNWGPEYSEPRRLVSTHWGYDTTLEYKINTNWAISLKHRSNCKSFCRKVPGFQILPKGGKDTHNSGFNYLMVR